MSYFGTRFAFRLTLALTMLWSWIGISTSQAMIMMTQGPVVIVGDGNQAKPPAFTWPDKVALYPETATILKNVLPLDVDTSGKFDTRRLPPDARPLPVDTEIVVYRLRVRDAQATQGQPRLITGSVTFTEPILGIIITSPLMNKADHVLGVRYLDPSDPSNMGQLPGTMLFSIDRAMLTLTMNVMVDASEPMEWRVITRVPPIHLITQGSNGGLMPASWSLDGYPLWNQQNLPGNPQVQIHRTTSSERTVHPVVHPVPLPAAVWMGAFLVGVGLAWRLIFQYTNKPKY